MKNKTHVIDGVTYVEVERKAEVGDKILVLYVYGRSWDTLRQRCLLWKAKADVR
jgi:hypothetical protein